MYNRGYREKTTPNQGLLHLRVQQTSKIVKDHKQTKTSHKEETKMSIKWQSQQQTTQKVHRTHIKQNTRTLNNINTHTNTILTIKHKTRKD